MTNNDDINATHNCNGTARDTEADNHDIVFAPPGLNGVGASRVGGQGIGRRGIGGHD